MERGFFSFISTKRVAQSTLETISVEAIVTGPIKLIGEIKLDTMSCSGPSMSAASASFLWCKAEEGLESPRSSTRHVFRKMSIA